MATKKAVVTKTVIMVNNQLIKEVKGKTLTVSQALKLAVPYFGKIAKEKVEVKKEGGVTTILFKIEFSRKG